ncbi:MAG: hypothetical protein ACRBHB_21825 [Arenicella sp.]
MLILTYKRTHTGDPSPDGVFGINDCMGKVRNFSFDAVIGVGGIGLEAKSHNIDRKICWVGIWPMREEPKKGMGSIIRFEYFRLFEEMGPLLAQEAPALARRMYDGKARLLIKSYSEKEYEEAEKIVEWAKREKQPELSEHESYECRSKCKPNPRCKSSC